MLVGYMRASKADGSQTTDPQRDALVEAGVEDERLNEDRASGRRDDRPGLAGTCTTWSTPSTTSPLAASV